MDGLWLRQVSPKLLPTWAQCPYCHQVLTHLSLGFLPWGPVALGLIMGPVDHILLRPGNISPDPHCDLTEICPLDWSFHCSPSSPLLFLQAPDAHPFPDEGVVNGCLDSAGCTLWFCLGPPVLLRYVSSSDDLPSQSHIHSLVLYHLWFSNTSTEALGYFPLQNQVRQT